MVTFVVEVAVGLIWRLFGLKKMTCSSENLPQNVFFWHKNGEKTRENHLFLQKNRRNIWWVFGKYVPLHSLPLKKQRVAPKKEFFERIT